MVPGQSPAPASAARRRHSCGAPRDHGDGRHVVFLCALLGGVSPADRRRGLPAAALLARLLRIRTEPVPALASMASRARVDPAQHDGVPPVLPEAPQRVTDRARASGDALRLIATTLR